MAQLDASRNALTVLPVTVGLLDKLVVVNLSHNPDLTALPGELGLCATLETLLASHCALQDLPSDLSALVAKERTERKKKEKIKEGGGMRLVEEEDEEKLTSKFAEL